MKTKLTLIIILSMFEGVIIWLACNYLFENNAKNLLFTFIGHCFTIAIIINLFKRIKK